jgi:hypothetical protein
VSARLRGVKSQRLDNLLLNRVCGIASPLSHPTNYAIITMQYNVLTHGSPNLPGIILQSGVFNAIIAPEEMILAGLNDNPVIDRYTTLFICGNFSRILNGINRRSTNFHIQRAFTVHQLLTILHETYHSIVFLEHDPTLYDDAGNVKTEIPRALKEISHDKIVILYAPKMDRHLSFLISNADRIYVIEASNESCRSRKRHLIKTHNTKISDY